MPVANSQIRSYVRYVNYVPIGSSKLLNNLPKLSLVRHLDVSLLMLSEMKRTILAWHDIDKKLPNLKKLKRKCLWGDNFKNLPTTLQVYDENKVTPRIIF